MANVNRHTFRFIESRLYEYPKMKQDIEDQRDSIIYARQQLENGNRPPGCISDTTGSKAIQLISSPSLIFMENFIWATELSLDLLGPQHRELFRMKYILRFSSERVCMEMPCSDRSFYRHRREIVEMVSSKMGFCRHDVFYE